MLVTQLCWTLCNPMDCSPPGSSVHGILQARMLEWVAIPYCRGIFLTQGLKTAFPVLQADSLLSEPPRKPLLIKQGPKSVIPQYILLIKQALSSFK